MTFGQITEQEAVTRGLLSAAVAELDVDGRVLVRHAGSCLQWSAKAALVRPTAPPWHGGLPL